MLVISLLGLCAIWKISLYLNRKKNEKILSVINKTIRRLYALVYVSFYFFYFGICVSELLDGGRT